MIPAPRIVFYGTPDFAVASLKAIVDQGFPVVGVVTVQDKPSGRGLRMVESSVKQSALQLKIPVLQPANLKSDDFLGELEQLNPDIQVVVAFRMLPRRVWELPRMGTFNLHASLLPQYRGAAPINHAILAGEKKTGVTTFLIDEQIDTGSVLMQEEVAIGPDENAGELYERLKECGARLVVETIKQMVSGKLESRPQRVLSPPDTLLRRAPKITRDDLKINWNLPVQDIYNRIRAFSPYPGIILGLPLKEGGMLEVKIREARMRKPEAAGMAIEPGMMVTDGKRSLEMAAKDGFIQFIQLQPLGRGIMDVTSFLNGFGAKLRQNP